MSDLEIRQIGLETLASPIRYHHDGLDGGAQTKGFSIKSVSKQHVYTNIRLSINEIAEETIQAADFFTQNGWSMKLLTKDNSSFPSEEDWSEVFPMTNINLENIGDVSTSEYDDSKVQYFFIRIFCPGHTDPGQYNHKMSITYNKILLT